MAMKRPSEACRSGALLQQRCNNGDNKLRKEGGMDDQRVAQILGELIDIVSEIVERTRVQNAFDPSETWFDRTADRLRALRTP